MGRTDSEDEEDQRFSFSGGQYILQLTGSAAMIGTFPQCSPHDVAL